MSIRALVLSLAFPLVFFLAVFLFSTSYIASASGNSNPLQTSQQAGISCNAYIANQTLDIGQSTQIFVANIAGGVPPYSANFMFAGPNGIAGNTITITGILPGNSIELVINDITANSLSLWIGNNSIFAGPQSISAGANTIFGTFNFNAVIVDSTGANSLVENAIPQITIYPPANTTATTNTLNNTLLSTPIIAINMLQAQSNPVIAELVSRFITAKNSYAKGAPYYKHPAQNLISETSAMEKFIGNVLAANVVLLYGTDNALTLNLVNITIFSNFSNGRIKSYASFIPSNVSAPILIYPNSIINAITVKTNSNISNISTSVIFNSSPINFKLPYYALFQINSTLNDSNVISATYNFSVSKAWVSSLGISPSQVTLYKRIASNNTWIPLPTYLVGNNAGLYFYTAYSSSLSTYLVSFSTGGVYGDANPESVTLPTGYKLYICAAGANYTFATSSPAVSWTPDINAPPGASILGSANASVGHQTSNVCEAYTTGAQFPGLAIAGIGLNQTRYKVYSNAVGYSTNASLSYTVATSNSFIVLAGAAGYYNFTTITLPAGCQMQVRKDNLDTYETAFIATCQNAAAGTYMLSANLSNYGSAALAAYVFPPYNVIFQNIPNVGKIVVNNEVITTRTTVPIIGSGNIIAIPSNGFVFDHWRASNANLSIGNIYSNNTNLTVNGNGSIIAYYAKVVAPQNGKYILGINQSSSTYAFVLKNNIPIEKVSVNLKKSPPFQANAILQNSKYLPNGISAPATKVFNYTIINESWAGLDANVSNVTYYLAVPMSWVSSNKQSNGNVKLYKYSGSAWITLPTTYVGTNGTYYFYTATSNSLSTYAVGFATGNTIAKASPGSLTLPTGYPTYFYALGLYQYLKNKAPTYTTKWINDSKYEYRGYSSGTNYYYMETSIGHSLQNTGTYTSTASTLYAALAGIAANVLMQNGNVYSANTAGTSLSLSYNVQTSNSFVILMFSSAYSTFSAVPSTTATGCITQQYVNNAGHAGAAIITCNSVAAGSYTATASTASKSSLAAVAYVFPPYNVVLDDNPATATITTNGNTYSNGMVMQVIGTGPIAANPPTTGNWIFNSWTASNTINLTIANTLSQSTSLTVMGNGIVTATWNGISKFYETGLPSSTTWNVIYNSRVNSSSTTMISFSVLPGTYSFTVANQVVSGSTYIPTPSSGTLYSGNTITVTFASTTTTTTSTSTTTSTTTSSTSTTTSTTVTTTISSCNIALSPNSISFGNIAAYHNTPTNVVVSDSNSGSSSATMYVAGTNWIFGSNSFGVSNTTWSATALAIYGGNALTSSLASTGITVPAGGSANVFFGVAIPAGTPPGDYDQTITIENSC
jgi:PGF-pre-PGF domain-containing protein